MGPNDEGVTAGGGDEGRPRPRGRPKKSVPVSDAGGLSIENPTEALPPAARGILEAAREVLAERGLEGLTVEAVANQANVSRTSIPYHFGSRAGLVAILVDSLFHDFAVEIWQRQQAHPGERGLDDFLEMVRHECADVRGQQDFFELVVYAMRDAEVRRRVAALFADYRRLNLHLAGVDADGADGARLRRLTAVGAVLQALTDGLALQAVFDPAFDLQAAIDAVQALLGPTLGKATAE